MSSPPPTPPQLSPDGRWVWDGHQWQPVPVVAGDVAGLVPVVAAEPTPAPAPAAVAYTTPQAQATVIPYAVPTAEESEATPLWQEPPRQGISIYLFAAAAVVVLIMAMMALNALQIVQMPWQTDKEPPRPSTATPTPQLTVRSEYARAERFLNFTLSPAVASLNLTLPALSQTCNGTMSNSCQSAITASDQQLKKVLAVIDRGDIPPCIAAGMSRIRADFVSMDEGLQLALKGFKDDNKGELTQGLGRAGATAPALQADAKAVEQAQKTQCSTDQTGP